LGITHCNT